MKRVFASHPPRRDSGTDIRGREFRPFGIQGNRLLCEVSGVCQRHSSLHFIQPVPLAQMLDLYQTPLNWHTQKRALRQFKLAVWQRTEQDCEKLHCYFNKESQRWCLHWRVALLHLGAIWRWVMTSHFITTQWPWLLLKPDETWFTTRKTKQTLLWLATGECTAPLLMVIPCNVLKSDVKLISAKPRRRFRVIKGLIPIVENYLILTISTGWTARL